MACGEAVEREVTWREWCWTWHGPWRCKKTAIKTMYQYDFIPTRTVFAILNKKYQGCCGGKLYEWSTGFTIFGSGNGPWDSFNTVTKFFAKPLSPKGDCPV